VRISVARLAGGRYLGFDTIVRKLRKAGSHKVTVRVSAGTYRATMRATDPAGHRSRAKSIVFRIGR
jgi:hypothetical protein